MVNETDYAIMVCAVLTEGVLERDITVYLSTADGTAFGEYKNTVTGRNDIPTPSPSGPSTKYDNMHINHGITLSLHTQITTHRIYTVM